MGKFPDFSPRPPFDLGKRSALLDHLSGASVATGAFKGWKPPTVSSLIGEHGTIAAAFADQYANPVSQTLALGIGSALSKEIAVARQAAFLRLGAAGSPLKSPFLEAIEGKKREKSWNLLGSNLLGPRDSSERLARQLQGFIAPPGLKGRFLEGWKPPTVSSLTGQHGTIAAAFADQYANPVSQTLALGIGSALGAAGFPLKSPFLEAIEGKFAWSPQGAFRPFTLFERMEQVERELAETDPACARLSVLLGRVGVGRAIEMMERMVAEGTAPLLEVLDEILLAAGGLEIFEHAVRSANLPMLVEGDLIHGLEHLHEASPDHALPPLLNGLEGALRDAAHKRGDRKKRSNARSLAAALEMEKEHELLVAVIYDQANDGRHGAELDRRQACVLVLVGLVLWMTECRDEPGTEWLSREVDKRLSIPAAMAA